MKGEKRDAWGDSFYMKHSAELYRNGFTVLPRMAICEEVPHLKIYYVYEGSGLDRSIPGWFRTSLETFPGENVVSRESNRDLWSPFVNKDVGEVDRSDLNSGKAIYSRRRSFS